MGAGLYEVKYRVFESGEHSLRIRTGVSAGSVVTGGADIRCGRNDGSSCSPFAIVVVPGPSVGRTSEVSGEALRSAVAGQTRTL